VDAAADEADHGREPSSLAATTRVLSRHVLAILVVTTLVVAVVLVHDLTATRIYQARSQLLVGSLTSQLAQIVSPNSQSAIDPAREQATALLLANSPGVAQKARTDLGLKESAAKLNSEVVASSEPEADLITLTAQDPDPGRAARLANGFADAFVALRTESNRRSTQQAADVIQRQIDGLAKSATSRRNQLQSVLDKIETLNVVGTGRAEVVDRAEVPDGATYPKPVRDAILALLVGLVGGVMVAFTLEAFDRRVRGPRELEALTGLPILAVIPHLAVEPRSKDERREALEPYRILRAGFEFLGAGTDPRVIAVMSARTGDGRTTVALGLARECALAGDRVVLVEADMRNPSFGRRFDLGYETPGLAAVIAGQAPLPLLRQILPGIKTLTALPAGAAAESASDALGSVSFDKLLGDLVAAGMRVIIDGPSLLGYADGQALLTQPRLDACMVVGRLGRTVREDAVALRTALERHRLLNTGLVVNGARDRDLESWDGTTAAATSPVAV
jgi:succinoglycan biosynthesis transport protein ExoP